MSSFDGGVGGSSGPGPSTALEATEPGGMDSVGTAARQRRGEIWRRFRRNRAAMVGLCFLAVLVVVAILAPWIAPYEITERDSGNFRASPSMDHLFGTDTIGRDVFSRVVFGARFSLKIGLAATAISITIGLVLGATAGFFGGLVETLIMRFTDVFLAIPYVVLAVAIAAVLGKGENTVILVLGFTGWLGICRIVRSSFLGLKQLEYVEAARALGYTRRRIMFRHMLPNALQPIIVYGTIAVGTVILAEAALSYLGVGPQDPTPAWGLMVRDAKSALATGPHMLFFPGGAIFLTVLSLVFVGDGLRDALDPKLK